MRQKQWLKSYYFSLILWQFLGLGVLEAVNMPIPFSVFNTKPNVIKCFQMLSVLCLCSMLQFDDDMSTDRMLLSNSLKRQTFFGFYYTSDSWTLLKCYLQLFSDCTLLPQYKRYSSLFLVLEGKYTINSSLFRFQDEFSDQFLSCCLQTCINWNR